MTSSTPFTGWREAIAAEYALTYNKHLQPIAQFSRLVGGGGWGKRDAVALMVRSGEGTIDEPHFIWMKDGDSFKSVTKGTADASSMDSDLSQATSAMVANSINCLTADFR